MFRQFKSIRILHYIDGMEPRKAMCGMPLGSLQLACSTLGNTKLDSSLGVSDGNYQFPEYLPQQEQILHQVQAAEHPQLLSKSPNSCHGKPRWAF